MIESINVEIEYYIMSNNKVYKVRIWFIDDVSVDRRFTKVPGEAQKQVPRGRYFCEQELSSRRQTIGRNRTLLVSELLSLKR